VTGWPANFPWTATTGLSTVTALCPGAGTEQTATAGTGQVNWNGNGNVCYASRAAAGYAAYPAIPAPPQYR